MYLSRFFSIVIGATTTVPALASDELTPRSFLCTGDGITRNQTGLGQEVDEVAHIPNRLRAEVKSALGNRWTFEYADAAYTYREQKQVTVRRGASVLNMVSQLSHEVGHANYSYKPDLTSREAYIRKACTDEGRAVLENIHAYNAMKVCDGRDLALITAAPAVLLAKYDELSQSPPIQPAEIGYMFCETNRVPTGQTYIDYYGEWYDANHASALVSGDVNLDPELWLRIAGLAEGVRHGGGAARAVWPLGSQASFDPTSQTWRATALPLTARTSISHSEIRVADDGRVAIAYLELGGRCITRGEVLAHYPGLELTSAPRAHGPLGSRSTVWSAFGAWGEVMFAFAEESPKCVRTVSFAPDGEAVEATPL